MMTINYRNEPLAMRVRDSTTLQQPLNDRGDLSLAFSSTQAHADARFNQFGPYGQRPGELRRDPFTPLMRVYEHDRVRVNLLVGAHEEGHNVNIRGTRWLFEPHDLNSGWRNSQMAAISEYHRFFLTPLIGNPHERISDFVYESGASDDRWTGSWGLLRMYRTRQLDLCKINQTTCPNNSGGLSLGEREAREEELVSKGMDADDAERIALQDTGEPESLSLVAALADSTSATRASLTGKTQMDSTKSPVPDPADTTTWKGDLATLEANEATDPLYSPTLKTSGGPTSSDSVKLGYGNQPIGGIADYDQFEYEPASRTETVTMNGTPPSSLGLTYAGVLSYVVEPDGSPGEYEMAGPKWTASGRRPSSTDRKATIPESTPPEMPMTSFLPRVAVIRLARPCTWMLNAS